MYDNVQTALDLFAKLKSIFLCIMLSQIGKLFAFLKFIQVEDHYAQHAFKTQRKGTTMKTINEYQQKVMTKKILVMSCLSAVLGLTGCPDGSSEQAGQRMEPVVEKTENKMDRATEQAEHKAEAAKESLGKKADQAQEYIEEKADASKDKIDEATNKAEEKLEAIKDSVIEKPETTGEYIDDSVITTKVKAAILGNSSLSASHIEVTTDKGIVKLSGTVDSEQSISKAIEVASNEKNVKAVKSALTVSVTAPEKQ